MMFHSGTELINPFKILEAVGIRPGMHVADLGCGALGHFVFPAAQLVGASGCVYAVDIQKNALATVERQAKHYHYWNVYPVWSDIDVYGATRIPDHSLDLTLIVNNFFLSTNRPALVQEAIRLTRPGGRIVVIEWNKRPSAIGPDVSRRIGPEEVRPYFQDPALSAGRAFIAGSDHYGLLFRRVPEDQTTMILSVSYSLDQPAPTE